MSVKKTKISMKPFIQNEDIICMRKNGKVSYHAQFASAAIVKTHNKMMTNWDDYNDESEEYVISASLGYSLYNSLVDLQIDISTLEDTVSGLQTKIDELDTNSGGGSVGNSSTYTLRLGDIIIQANPNGTVLTIKNATSSTKQVALKVSGNVVGYV